MEINLKIKFDKHHHKTNTWDRPEMPYFLDSTTTNTKRLRQSPKSMREDYRPATQRKEK